MKQVPIPIFQNRLPKVSWMKIYEREYGVQYSELAVLCVSEKAKQHIPSPSTAHIVIPSENNTAFYIDSASWIELVESLNRKYTVSVKKLKAYEKQFVFDGEAYVKTAKKIARLNLKKLSSKELGKYYKIYQEKAFNYGLFAWTAFILNNYVSERAMMIVDRYIAKRHREKEKQGIHDSLFKPIKKAAILELQYQIEKRSGSLTKKEFDGFYEAYKWLSCLDLHNKPWTKIEFKNHIRAFSQPSIRGMVAFEKIAKELNIEDHDLQYLLMAKRLVYIKDARDDYRRQGVFYALTFFNEIARRAQIQASDVSYLLTSEISGFLERKQSISKRTIEQRKNGFVLYLDKYGHPICLEGADATRALTMFHLNQKEAEMTKLSGKIASRGVVTGKAVIVKGVKDLNKVRKGDILVAVTTHPDYVPAMRRAAAIVTDEGGITSHAAIVSREFGIPCIVGTKTATHILKDGDSVRVDADNGTVTRIS